jgi:hypothetical protein
MKLLACTSALLLASACSPAQQGPEQTSRENAPSTQPAPAAPPPPQSSSTPPAPTAENIVSEAPFSDTSAQGAANVVQTYYALIEAKKYGEAHKIWGSNSDLADTTFADQFSSYREYHAQVLAPGGIEGAAGSAYVEVPVRIYGMTNKGERFEEPAVVTLRRVNDVDGSTAEQRRWHIMKIDRPPH